MRARVCVLTALSLLGGLLVALGSAAPAQAAVTVYPVPTSSAGLGRIVTAPDGSMWFAEDDANKVGRITPGGVITEFPLPQPGTDVDGPVQDIDVAPDGTVWVIGDHGRVVHEMAPNGTLRQTYDLFDTPYGGQIRVDHSGVAWVTMNFDESGIARIVPGRPASWPVNAPACEDVLGEAADGSMWCGGDDEPNSLVHVNADGTGGVTYPLPEGYASYPRGIAAGPVGSIWFTRAFSGTWLTPPNDGYIGYLDAGSGASQIWDTGDRTAPNHLLQGPDGAMWFTNIGAEPAIGHINASGVGAITKVGAYKPWALTFGTDGAVWFTDPSANSIVRVTTDQLQTTNVDVGDIGHDGYPPMIFAGTPGPAPAPGPAPGPGPGPAARQPGSLPKVKNAIRVKKRRLSLRVSCRAGSGGCEGTAVVATKGTKAKPITKRTRYRLDAGDSTKLRLKVTKKGMRKLRRQPTRMRAQLFVPGAKKPAVMRTVKVRR